MHIIVNAPKDIAKDLSARSVEELRIAQANLTLFLVENIVQDADTAQLQHMLEAIEAELAIRSRSGAGSQIH